MKITYIIRRRYDSLTKSFSNKEVTVDIDEKSYRFLMDVICRQHNLNIDKVKELLPYDLPEHGITITKIE